MNKFLAILVGLIIFTSSFAIPYAVLGNINVPDAYILPSKMVELSIVNYFVEAKLPNSPDPDSYEFAAAVSFMVFFTEPSIRVSYVLTAPSI